MESLCRHCRRPIIGEQLNDTELQWRSDPSDPISSVIHWLCPSRHWSKTSASVRRYGQSIHHEPLDYWDQMIWESQR